MKTDFNIQEYLKKAIMVVAILIVILGMIVGVLTSDFKKIKKFDSSEKSPRQLVSSIVNSSKYYNTRISINKDSNIANLGDFTFNVSNKKMLIANISLKYKSNKQSTKWSDNTEEIQQEIMKKGTILRDAVIDTMIGSYDTNANSKRMKREIKRNINKKLSEGEIEEVYFNKFIFQ